MALGHEIVFSVTDRTILFPISSMISNVCLCNSFESIVFILSSQGLLSIDTVQEYLRPFADLMMVINSGVNVTIYCGFNKDFRDKFCQMYFRKLFKGPAAGSNTYQLGLINTQSQGGKTQVSQETTL